jgi:hypothetical protein
MQHVDHRVSEQGRSDVALARYGDLKSTPTATEEMHRIAGKSPASAATSSRRPAATLIAFNILETTLDVGDYRKDIHTAQRGVGGVWKESPSRA